MIPPPSETVRLLHQDALGGGGPAAACVWSEAGLGMPGQLHIALKHCRDGLSSLQPCGSEGAGFPAAMSCSALQLYTRIWSTCDRQASGGRAAVVLCKQHSRTMLPMAPGLGLSM